MAWQDYGRHTHTHRDTCTSQTQEMMKRHKKKIHCGRLKVFEQARGDFLNNSTLYSKETWKRLTRPPASWTILISLIGYLICSPRLGIVCTTYFPGNGSVLGPFHISYFNSLYLKKWWVLCRIHCSICKNMLRHTVLHLSRANKRVHELLLLK